MSPTNSSSTPVDPLDAARTYIDGKMRRYSLMFTVNGAAFAIVTFASKAITAAADKPVDWEVALPGALQLTTIAAGAILFTFLMFLDIWAWGWLMRRDFLHDSFSVLGRCILAGMATLIVCGWSFGADWIQPPRHQLLFAGAIFLALLLVGQLTGMALDYFQPQKNRESPAAGG